MTFSKSIPRSEHQAVYIRTIQKDSLHNNGYKKPRIFKQIEEPTDYSLIFDTETTITPDQNLRFGVYQVRLKGKILENGLFYSSEIESSDNRVIENYSVQHGLRLLNVETFVSEILYEYGFDLQSEIIGFNLPFDISRLAFSHSPAKSKIMKGGFSFKLSKLRLQPPIQVKHLNRRAAMISFASSGSSHTPKNMKKEGERVQSHRGYFYDVKTMAAALTSRSWSLGQLSEFLKIQNGKLKDPTHGAPLDFNYINYAVRDVQATWECFQKLKVEYERHHLSKPLHKIKSEAGLGKAYLKEMNIQPWLKMQPDFSKRLISHAMSSYYGGRSEIHYRRKIAQVLYCDFRSMYPTVCNFMKLWEWIISKGVTYRHCKEETTDLLHSVSLDDLQNIEFWPQLTTLVCVSPDQDILPVRAKYDDKQATIGLNYLSAEGELWFTLADCIASKLLTGKAPIIIDAIRFSPKTTQDGLKRINLFEDEALSVDPNREDFFNTLLNLRNSIKRSMKNAPDDTSRGQLDTQQQALKILANSTSYGIYIELNVEELSKTELIDIYKCDGETYSTRTDKLEKLGQYFHPLLATFITGAARLKLAITERLILDSGLNWAFCDTDSMAIMKPDSMDFESFRQKVKDIQHWFNPLNPYKDSSPLLQLEDANFVKDNANEFEPLYFLAISAKRYVLFNKDSLGNTIIRKASAHGLGQYVSPIDAVTEKAIIESTHYDEKCGVSPWQHEFWLEIIKMADGTIDSFDFEKLSGFELSITSKYAATSPKLLDWFKLYNNGKAYSEQVKPFNFMLSHQIAEAKRPDIAFTMIDKSAYRPISPYAKDINEITQTFDRITGAEVVPDELRTYAEALMAYPMQPESKFLNGGYADKGFTYRRHINATEIHYIGKESNKWEEHFNLGFDEDDVIEYGLTPATFQKRIELIQKAIRLSSKQTIADHSRISVKQLSNILIGKNKPSLMTFSKLCYAANSSIEAEETKQQKLSWLKEWITEEIKASSQKEVAHRLGTNSANLSNLLNGKRTLTDKFANKIMSLKAEKDCLLTNLSIH